VSYDLRVYAPVTLSSSDIRSVVAGGRDLAVGEFDEARGWHSVVRGAKGRYCFTVDGPVQVDPEDVPDEVTAVLLGATHVFFVRVEGSADVDVPHAVRFARRLAESLGGVVVDPQTDQVWSRGVLRTAAKPARDQRVNVITLAWYTRFQSVGSDFGARYLAICRRLLPEALPRRFGETEPLQGKLTDGGDEGFAQAWSGATSLLFFVASPPCIGGSMYAGPGEQHRRPVWRMSLQAHYEPLRGEPLWRDAVRRFFVAVSEDLDAFFASAEVTRGSIWNGRSLWADANTEWTIMPARVNGWMGLPPYPVWWAWYGEPYSSLVQGRLDAGDVTRHPRGLLHQLAAEPLDREHLTRLVTSRRGLRRVAAWVPSELLAKERPADRPVQPIPLALAEHIPSELI
jgi:hypothetical protein